MKEPLEIKVGPGRNLRRLLMILGAGAFVGFCVAVAGIYCRVFSPGGNFIDTRAHIVIGLVLVILFTAIMPLIPFFSDFAFNRLRLYDDRLELTSLAYGRIQCARKKTFPRTAIS